MHNVPGMPVGTFASKVGPLMAAADHIEITIEGKGAHAAMPHNGVDTVADRLGGGAGVCKAIVVPQR